MGCCFFEERNPPAAPRSPTLLVERKKKNAIRLKKVTPRCGGSSLGEVNWITQLHLTGTAQSEMNAERG